MYEKEKRNSTLRHYYLQVVLLPQVDVTVGGQTEFGSQLIKWRRFPQDLLLNACPLGSLAEACQKQGNKYQLIYHHR